MPDLKSLVYDFQGKSPARVMVPHVVCSVSTAGDKPRYNGIFPLDTGAKSDITFHGKLKDHIAHHSAKVGHAVSVGVGALSTIRHRKGSYHAEHEPHVGDLDEGRVLPPQPLTVGSRGDGKTTLSLAALKLAGRCAIVDPTAGESVEIVDYGAMPVYSTDVSFAKSLDGFEFELSCNKEHIDTLATTHFMPPGRWLKNKQDERIEPFLKQLSKKSVCWDTGAAYTTIDGRLFRAWNLGKVLSDDLGVIDEISFLARDKHTLLRCRNVPVRIDDTEFIIGAPILNLFRMGFDPSGARIALSLLPHEKWTPELIPFDTDLELGTFISWKKP